MKYSVGIDFSLPNMYDLYWKEFGHKLDDKDLYYADKRILPVVTGFIITAKEIMWPVSALMEALDLTLETARIFVTNPQRKLMIHRDCVADSNTLRQWAINIPIANCDMGTNEWFADADNDFGKEKSVPGGSALAPEWFDNNYKVSESNVLNGIKLIRTDVMHRSNNTGNDNRRAVLSLRGDPKITYKQAKEKINDYNRRCAEDLS